MTAYPSADRRPEPTLTIGDLAQETGLTPAVLRMWETRHGFPVAQRLASGHRRYSPDQIALVKQVVHRRNGGVRLEVAIAEALASVETSPRSVFAALRQRHRTLQPYRLRKSTLIALSWALEDEFCAVADKPLLFGAFQSEQHWSGSAARWTELARVAASTIVLADFGELADDGVAGVPTKVPLPEDSPMHREWVVVCDGTDHTGCLAAWEVPGQSRVPERERLFEAVWTVDPRTVRDAARVCASVAAEAGCVEAAPLQFVLAQDPVGAGASAAGTTALFNRVVAYIDRLF